MLRAATRPSSKENLPARELTFFKSILNLPLQFYNQLRTTLTKPRPEEIEYHLSLMSDGKLAPHVIEFNCEDDGIRYRVIGLDEVEESGLIPWKRLPKDFPTDSETILAKKYDCLPAILEVTSRAGHTHFIANRFRYAHETLFRVFNNFDGLVSDYKKELSTDTKLITVLKAFSTLQKELTWFSLILSLLMFPIGLYRVFHTLFINDSPKVTRGVILGITVVNIALATLGLLVSLSAISIATPALVIIGAVRGLFEKIWFLGDAIYRRQKAAKLVSTLRQSLKAELLKDKLKDKPNAEQVHLLAMELGRALRDRTKRNKKILERIHSFVTNALGAAGSLMLITPAAPVGLILLAVLSVYKILDTLQINPLRRLASFINKIGRRNTDPLRNKSAGKPFINVSYRPKLSDDEHKQLKSRKLPFKERMKQRAILHRKMEKIDAEHLLDYYCAKLKVPKPINPNKNTAAQSSPRTARIIDIPHPNPTEASSSPAKAIKPIEPNKPPTAPSTPRQNGENIHRRLRERSASHNGPTQVVVLAPAKSLENASISPCHSSVGVAAPEETQRITTSSCALFAYKERLTPTTRCPSAFQLGHAIPVVAS